MQKGGSTGNYRTHLRKHHQEEYLKMMTTSYVILPSSSSNARESPLLKSFQMADTNGARASLCRFIATANIPLQAVENPYFMEFCHHVAKTGTYKPPSRTTASNQLTELAMTIRERIAEEARSAQTVVIGSDGWSSRKGIVSLLSITVHFLCSSKRFNRVLDCIPLIAEHSAINISNALREYGVDRIGSTKVKYLIADGASVMISAAGLLGVEHLHCAAHVVNLAVQKFLKVPEIRVMVDKVKAMIPLSKGFKKRRLLKSACKKVGIAYHEPAMECVTRWSSAYQMLCDFESIEPAINELIESGDYGKISSLSQSEKITLSYVRKLLAPFYDATKKLSKQDEVLGIVLLIFRGLIKTTYENFLSGPRSCSNIAKMLHECAEEYLSPFSYRNTYRFASLCDPRCAFMTNVVGEQSWSEIVEAFIEDKVQTKPAHIDNTPTAKHSKDHRSFLTTMYSDESTNNGDSDESNTLAIELQRYKQVLRRARPYYDANAVEWWEENGKDYPQLFAIAQEYMAIPPSSVDSERLFSCAGSIYGNKKRARLCGETARDLLTITADSVKSKTSYWSTSTNARYDYDEYQAIIDESNDEEDENSSNELDMDDVEVVSNDDEFRLDE